MFIAAFTSLFHAVRHSWFGPGSKLLRDCATLTVASVGLLVVRFSCSLFITEILDFHVIKHCKAKSQEVKANFVSVVNSHSNSCTWCVYTNKHRACLPLRLCQLFDRSLTRPNTKLKDSFQIVINDSQCYPVAIMSMSLLARLLVWLNLFPASTMLSTVSCRC